MKYEFKPNIRCDKCGSQSVRLRDNMYYVKLAKIAGWLCCITIVGIPFGIGCFVAAAQKKKQPIGMVQCLSCGEIKNYKKGELYIT